MFCPHYKITTEKSYAFLLIPFFNLKNERNNLLNHLKAIDKSTVQILWANDSHKFILRYSLVCIPQEQN